MLACQRPARRGGATVLVDGRALHDDLRARHPEALRTLSSPGAAYFGGANGYSGPVFTAAHPGTRSIRWSTDQRSQLSPLARPWHATLHHLISEHTHTVLLGAGDDLVVHNRWWLHGHREFRGDRALWRILANPHPHWHIPPGFPATTPPPTGLPAPRTPQPPQAAATDSGTHTHER
ncbi:TauD/TfdA family dioxygenase [Saccharothrix sp. AJ9571]|nr:TauD/TfdA family dioxygenase [Saccharothrix sp. AJ9571]